MLSDLVVDMFPQLSLFFGGKFECVHDLFIAKGSWWFICWRHDEARASERDRESVSKSQQVPYGGVLHHRLSTRPSTPLLPPLLIGAMLILSLCYSSTIRRSWAGGVTSSALVIQRIAFTSFQEHLATMDCASRSAFPVAGFS